MSVKVKRWGEKRLIALLVFISTSTAFFAQSTDTVISKKYDKHPIHSFGLSYTMATYFPEKIYDKIGLIEQRPKANFGNEIALNYNVIFLNGFGFSPDFIIGFMPDGTSSTSRGRVPKDTVWFNGYKGDPTRRRITNGFGVFYAGFNFKFNYLFKATKHLLIQPEMGIKTVYYAPSQNNFTESFCDNDNSQCIDYFFPLVSSYENINRNPNYNVKRYFFPDLLGGINFLIYPKNPRHCVKLGISFNYCFVPRLEGFYDVRNLGEKYNSSGKSQYTSTHFGFTIGYQFFSKQLLKRIYKNDVYLFNPRM